MPTTVYCDHNFIITAGQGSESYKNHLRLLPNEANVTFVLSPFHWMEIAEDADIVRGDGTADFVDSLGAQWLRARLNIQRSEVEDAFFRFAGIPSAPPRMIVDASDVIAELAGEAGERPTRNFVQHIRATGANHPLRLNVQLAFERNEANRARHREKPFSEEFRRAIQRIYVSRLLPSRTPAGLLIDASTKQNFLQVQQLTDFPSVALEMLATEDNWAQDRQLARNNFLDQQHLMALPYVDFFVTNDKPLTGLIARIVAGVPFPHACVITKEDFDLVFS